MADTAGAGTPSSRSLTSRRRRRNQALGWAVLRLEVRAFHSPAAAGRVPPAVRRASSDLSAFAFCIVGGGLLGGLLIADAIDDFGDNNDNNGGARALISS